MRGHPQRRGSDAWRLKVYVGRDANGTKRYVERTVNGTKKEAESELARIVVEADEGRHVATGPVTFNELIRRPPSTHRARLSEWNAIPADLKVTLDDATPEFASGVEVVSGKG